MLQLLNDMEPVLPLAAVVNQYKGFFLDDTLFFFTECICALQGRKAAGFSVPPSPIPALPLHCPVLSVSPFQRASLWWGVSSLPRVCWGQPGGAAVNDLHSSSDRTLGRCGAVMSLCPLYLFGGNSLSFCSFVLFLFNSWYKSVLICVALKLNVRLKKCLFF